MLQTALTPPHMLSCIALLPLAEYTFFENPFIIFRVLTVIFSTTFQSALICLFLTLMRMFVDKIIALNIVW